MCQGVDWKEEHRVECSKLAAEFVDKMIESATKKENEFKLEEKFYKLDKALSVQWNNENNEVGKDEKVFKTLNLMGESLMTCQRLVEAFQVFEHAHKLALSFEGERGSNVANVNLKMGAILDMQGKHEEALDKFKRALPIVYLICDDSGSRLFDVYSGMGHAYWGLGDLENTLKCYNKALNAKVSVDHPLCNLIRNMGVVLRNMGRILEAIDSLQRARSMHHMIISKDYMSIAEIHGILGSIYVEQEKYLQGIQNLEEKLFIYKKMLGEDHAKVADLQDEIDKVRRLMA